MKKQKIKNEIQELSDFLMVLNVCCKGYRISKLVLTSKSDLLRYCGILGVEGQVTCSTSYLHHFCL